MPDIMFDWRFWGGLGLIVASFTVDWWQGRQIKRERRRREDAALREYESWLRG